MNTYIIKWRGPFNDNELLNNDESHGLYLITGFQKYKRTENIQYCGITERKFFQRLNDVEHKKGLVPRERQFWLGKIISNSEVMRSDLEKVESLIIYFLQIELNVLKKVNAPKPTAIINRWYDKEGNLRKNIRHEAQKLEDVIMWDGELWHFSNRLKIQ